MALHVRVTKFFLLMENERVLLTLYCTHCTYERIAEFKMLFYILHKPVLNEYISIYKMNVKCRCCAALLIRIRLVNRKEEI